MTVTSDVTLKLPVNISSKAFNQNKNVYYKWLRENDPVHQGKLMGLMKGYFVSRYEDCVMVLKDPRFVRNRSTATGGRRTPFPMPKSVAYLAQSMIIEDDPAHRRLRNLVHKAFTPAAIRKLGERIESLTHELLDKAEKQSMVDLKEAYALPIPVTVISEMVGVSGSEMAEFSSSMRVLTEGFSGIGLFRTLFFDLRKTANFVRELVRQRRTNPQDDILTALIQAEEEGERLTEDELVSMVYLLIVAGYETTVHLISNAVVTLLQHSEELARLRAEPALMESAIEEVLRFNGPIHGTKPQYAVEDVTLQGVKIAKGSMVMPLLGAANHDAAVFEKPEVFDIARTPNKHLGFGHGIHYCLGAPLARMETKIALTTLLERNPNLRLAVSDEELRTQRMLLWHRYQEVPVVLG